MATEVKGISLKPSDAIEGGGLWSDIDGTLTKIKFINWDANGAIPGGAAYAELHVTDDNGVEYEQKLSCGKGKFTVSPDGRKLVPLPDATGGLRSSSNFMLFMTSLITAGFPEDNITDDITCVQGGKYHFDRVAAPKRDGVQKKTRADGTAYEDTVLIVTKILALPGEAPKGKGKATTAPAKAQGGKAVPDTNAGGEEVESLAISTVMEVLSENPEGLGKKELAKKAVMALGKGHALGGKIAQMVFQDAFLGRDDVPWSYENGVVSMG